MERPIPLALGTFHPGTAEIIGPRGTVRLTACEARLLHFLATHPGRFFTVEQLQREVWGYADGVSSRTAYVTLARLRAKMEVDPQHPRHIEAVRQLGYRFVPLAERADEEAERLLQRLEALGYRVSVTRAA